MDDEIQQAQAEADRATQVAETLKRRVQDMVEIRTRLSYAKEHVSTTELEVQNAVAEHKKWTLYFEKEIALAAQVLGQIRSQAAERIHNTQETIRDKEASLVKAKLALEELTNAYVRPAPPVVSAVELDSDDPGKINDKVNIEVPSKKGRALIYTDEEDEILRKFADDHKDKNLTQAQLWETAAAEDILDGRTATSMTQRYRLLKQAHNKKYKHYNSQDEENILAWAYCWYCKTPKKPHQGTIWQAAERIFLVLGKTASELESKFGRLTLKHGGNSKILGVAKEYASGQKWIHELYI